MSAAARSAAGGKRPRARLTQAEEMAIVAQLAGEASAVSGSDDAAGAEPGAEAPAAGQKRPRRPRGEGGRDSDADDSDDSGRRQAAAPVYPVSTTGACPYCQSPLVRGVGRRWPPGTRAGGRR
jgi:hypothetical protein